MLEITTMTEANKNRLTIQKCCICGVKGVVCHLPSGEIIRNSEVAYHVGGKLVSIFKISSKHYCKHHHPIFSEDK